MLKGYEFGFLLLDVVYVFYGQSPCLLVEVDGLHGLSIVIEFDTCEEGGVGLHGRFHGTA